MQFKNYFLCQCQYMILSFKFYSMLEEYRISELVKHFSFMLFSSFYPEVYRLLSNQTDPSIACNYFQNVSMWGEKGHFSSNFQRSVLHTKINDHWSNNFILQSPLMQTHLKCFSQEQLPSGCHGFGAAPLRCSFVTKGWISLPCLGSLSADGSQPPTLFGNYLVLRKLHFPRSHSLQRQFVSKRSQLLQVKRAFSHPKWGQL